MRLKRRCLHLGAGVAWTASLGLLCFGLHNGDETIAVRMLMMFTLTLATTFTSSAILVALLAPMRSAYRSGFRDGVESTNSQPRLTVVRNDKAVGESRWF